MSSIAVAHMCDVRRDVKRDVKHDVQGATVRKFELWTAVVS